MTGRKNRVPWYAAEVALAEECFLNTGDAVKRDANAVMRQEFSKHLHGSMDVRHVHVTSLVKGPFPLLMHQSVSAVVGDCKGVAQQQTVAVHCTPKGVLIEEHSSVRLVRHKSLLAPEHSWHESLLQPHYNQRKVSKEVLLKPWYTTQNQWYPFLEPVFTSVKPWAADTTFNPLLNPCRITDQLGRGFSTASKVFCKVPR